MKTENKIIRLFIENKKPKTIREIAKLINSDYKITHTAFQRLCNKKILIFEKVGKSLLCKLNNFYYGAEIYNAENERKEELLKNKNIKQFFKEITEKMKTSFFICLIFGSYVKQKQTKNSDLDIIFISNEKGFEERISNIISLLPIKIHPLIFNEEEFIIMRDSKKSNVIQEAMENNIILYGIENYYRLKNA